jgi:catalase
MAFVHDAYQHLKVIGHSDAAMPLLQKAGVVPDDGVVSTDKHFAKAAAKGRVWDREPSVRTIY